MHTYQKITIGDKDVFEASLFPALENSLHQMAIQLALLPDGPKAAMLLSFVKHHSINSQQANDHPLLALAITSKNLPLGILEDLFESGRNNPAFQKELEKHIISKLQNDIPAQNHTADNIAPAH